MKKHPHKIIWENRAKEIYHWYMDFLIKNGKSPTLQEAGKHYGLTSARMGQILQKMVNDGYLIRIYKKYHRPFTINPITDFGYIKNKKLVVKKVGTN